MGSIAYFQKLFEYAHWANREALRALQTCAAPPAKALQLLGHILAAEQVWRARLLGKDSSHLPIWPDYSLAECEALIETVFRGWQTYLEDLPPGEFARAVQYRNSKGTPFETAVGDILTHVIVHGGYHRGQIALLLRQAGEAPAVTDFIVYLRE